MYPVSRSVLTKLLVSSGSVLMLMMFSVSASADLKADESGWQPDALPEMSEFDLSVDQELADSILEREAELADVQTRGATANRSRSRILKSGTVNANLSVSAFKTQTQALGLQAAENHVKAVRMGAEANPEFLARAVLDAKELNPHEDIMAMLFMVFRASIQETNRDKRYFLTRLQEQNMIAQALGDYLKDLNDASRALAESVPGSDSGGGSGCDDDSGPGEVDTTILDPDHQLVADRILQERNWTKGPEGIALTTRQLEKMQRDVWKRRRVTSTAFQNADQKANQLLNLLSTVLKTTKEMQSGIKRNLR